MHSATAESCRTCSDSSLRETEFRKRDAELAEYAETAEPFVFLPIGTRRTPRSLRAPRPVCVIDAGLGIHQGKSSRDRIRRVRHRARRRSSGTAFLLGMDRARVCGLDGLFVTFDRAPARRATGSALSSISDRYRNHLQHRPPVLSRMPRTRSGTRRALCLGR